MGLIDINAVNEYLNTGVDNVGDLVNGYRGMMFALEAYISLRVGLGGSSDSFLAEVDEISEKAKKSCNELTKIHKQLKVYNPRKKTAIEKLKPYVDDLKELQADVISLVKKGW